MKLETRSNDVQKHGEMKSSIVGIAADGGATMIGRFLRDKLYTYKIRAIVREYCTNAIDEHIVCGKPDLPIKIVMPDAFESNLKIQDFGRGLSDYDVRNIFGMLAASTKRNSNALNGAMGLGSKAGWAYNDFWQLTSVHNGVRTEYSMFLNENDESEISELLSVVDTESPSGCTITIPIAKEDIPELRKEVAELAHDFSTPPTIVGMSEPLFKKNVLHTLNVDGVEVLMLQQSKYNRMVNVLMANVSYPVDLNVFGINQGYRYSDSSRKNDLKFALESKASEQLATLSCKFNIQINMPIGDVQVGMAREGLEYTESTKRKLHKILSAIPNAFEKEICEKYKDEPFIYSRILGKVFRSRTRDPDKRFTKTLKEQDPSQYLFYVFNERYSYKQSQYSMCFQKTPINSNRYETSYLVIGDLPVKESKQVAKLFNSELNVKLGYSEHDLNGNIELVILPPNVTPEEYVKECDIKDGFWVLASKLPKPAVDIDVESSDDEVPIKLAAVKPKTPKATIAKEKREAKYFIPTSTNIYSTARNTRWEIGQFDPAVKNYIFEINAFNIKTKSKDQTCTPSEMASLIKMLKAQEVIGEKDNVFGVRTSDLQEALKEGCVYLVDLTKNRDWKGLSFRNVEHNRYYNLFSKCGAIQIDKKALAAQAEQEGLLRSLFVLPDAEKPTTDKIDFFYCEIEKIKTQFPMLSVVSEWNFDNPIVINYVKSILDAQKEKEVKV